MTDKDPLTICQEALENHVRNDPRIKRIVKSGIVDGYLATRATREPDSLSEKDLPLIRLVPIGVPATLTSDSCHSTCVYTVQVELATGDMRFNQHLAPLWFALLCSLNRAIDEQIFRAVTWEGVQFIKGVELRNSAIAASQPNPTSKIYGWGAICNLTLTLAFPKITMREWSNLE